MTWPSNSRNQPLSLEEQHRADDYNALGLPTTRKARVGSKRLLKEVSPRFRSIGGSVLNFIVARLIYAAARMNGCAGRRIAAFRCS